MEKITEEELKKIMEIPGKVRGQAFVTDIEVVKEKKGEKGGELLKEKTKELGYPIDYEKMKITGWYPIGLRAVSLLAMKRAFGWGDKEIFDLGNRAPKTAFIVKMFLKYFLTFKMLFKASPKYWVKYYNTGKLEAHEFNEKEKYLVLRVHGIKVHPVLCPLFAGYFLRIAQYGGIKDATTEETKCVFKGDPYHEFVIRWE